MLVAEINSSYFELFFFFLAIESVRFEIYDLFKFKPTEFFLLLTGVIC